MRITSETMVMRSLDRLQTRLSSYERTQSELSTGKRILQPSDDPTGARRAMTLRSSMNAREQELKNVSDATGWLHAADSNLQSAVERLSRVRELATRAASEANASERQALAAEIEQITEEIAGIANAKHLDRPLFGGFADGAAVTRAPDGTWSAAGAGDEVMRRVSDSEKVRVNVTAAEWLGFDADGTGGDDLLTFLGGLADTVRDGPASAVGDKLGDLKSATDLVASKLAEVGVNTNRVNSARARAEDLLLTLRTELSDVEDVDIAQGVMELQVQGVAYEATLAAIGRALPPSLVGFLR
jgi:flagellar hook-associated protein 3 FlgL